MPTAREAFVVEIDERTDFDAGRLVGHVEHVLSGAYGEFDSADMLMGFIAEVLRPRMAAQAE